VESPPWRHSRAMVLGTLCWTSLLEQGLDRWTQSPCHGANRERLKKDYGDEEGSGGHGLPGFGWLREEEAEGRPHGLQLLMACSSSCNSQLLTLACNGTELSGEAQVGLGNSCAPQGSRHSPELLELRERWDTSLSHRVGVGWCFAGPGWAQ